MRSRDAVLISLFACLVSAAAIAQNNLLDNPNYRRSLDLRRQATAAFDSGEYLKSIEYAKQAEALSALARQEAELQLQRWTANSWKNRAAARIAFGERVNAAVRYPGPWTAAREAYGQALEDYKAERYESSTAASRKVVELLSPVVAEELSPNPPAAAVPETVPVAKIVPKPPVAISVKPAAKPAAKVLPEFYTVRLDPEQSESFWRIAGYPFVYGDPLKWHILYEANKNRLPDPENPDLLLPGVVLKIPSILGEIRSGTWSE